MDVRPYGAEHGILLTLSWSLDERDSSMWRYPLTVTVAPTKSDESWETVFDLSREQMRQVRDVLTMFLGCPDDRQDC